MNTQDELVDIVDEDGKCIETISKREAHINGALHRCVVSEVIDSQGRWLLVRQASDRQDAGQYVSPVGGHVAAGEKNEDALVREANEELGFGADLRYDLVGKTVYNRFVIGRQENHQFVLYVIYSDVVPVLNYESVDYAYFTEEELRTQLKDKPKQFGDAFHFVVKQFFPNLLS